MMEKNKRHKKRYKDLNQLAFSLQEKFHKKSVFKMNAFSFSEVNEGKREKEN